MSSIFDLDAQYNRSRVIKDLDIRDVEIEKLKQQLSALREAGEKMAERLRDLRKASYYTAKDADALAEWEAANE